MKKILVVFIFISFNLSAQFFPVLDLEGVTKSAEVHNLDVNIEIVGNIAQTTVYAKFYNPNDRVMEGELKFPLTPSQEVIDFYLDINGKLRKASVVEKVKGRIAYEATIRQKIDPGLLEKSVNNTFKARVFPIPPKGYKEVKITVQEELQLGDNGYTYTLPFNSEYVIPEFSLNATLYTDKKPKVSNTLDFENWNDTYTLKFIKKKYKTDKISFTIPQNDKKSWVENDYFYTTINTSDLFKVRQTKETPKPINLTIFWDISSSSKKKDLNIELDYLKKHLNRLNRKSVINIIPFNIKEYAPRLFKADDVDNIIKFITDQVYDGGTSLKKLNFNKIESDKILLFTDGISTFDDNSTLIYPAVPTTTITSTYSSNTSLLRYYALKTGGDYINLLSNSKNSSPKIVNIKSIGASEVYTDLELSDNELSISGKLDGNFAEIEIDFIKSDGSIINKTVKVKKQDYNVEVDLERLWAQKKLESLDLLYENNRDEITEIGKKYGIITRNTSLIVLDRVEDYVTYDIDPPEELRHEFDRLMAIKVKETKKSQNSSLAEALNEMNVLKSWWLKDFPKDKPQRKKQPVDTFGGDEESSEEPPVMMQRESIAPASNMDEISSEMDMESDKKSIGKDINNESINVEGWTPDAPYFKKLNNLSGLKLLTKYYELRDRYKDRPSFFIDVATLFYESGDNKNALLVISNIVEMGLDEPELLRITAYLLEKFGFKEEALDITFKLLEVRPQEPQTYRDIASLSLLNNDYQQALNFYYLVLTGSWDQRFFGIKSVVLNEMNYLISKYKNQLNLEGIDKRLIFDMPLGVRAVISWSSDNNDIDLWVKDPYKEDCGYSNKITHTGGKLSADFTGGYGPEEFTIKDALYGAYIVDINFFSDNRMSVSGPVTVKVDLYKNYGDGVIKETIIRRLSDVKERITIGSVNF